MQDPVAMEWQLGTQHLKRYFMPKEVVHLSLLLHELTSNSAMRHMHLQLDASLAWNSRHRHPLGYLLSIGAQLKNGLNTWYSVVEATDPNALPPLNAPYKVNIYPPCIANGSIIDESSGCMEGTFLRKKKDSINALYWHIILHVSTPKRRTEWVQNLLGGQVRVGLTLPCIMVCQMSLQSSRWEWAHFLNFIKSVVIPVFTFPCQCCKGITRNELQSIS
jgi:hypothetical protein